VNPNGHNVAEAGRVQKEDCRSPDNDTKAQFRRSEALGNQDRWNYICQLRSSSVNYSQMKDSEHK